LKLTKRIANYLFKYQLVVLIHPFSTLSKFKQISLFLALANMANIFTPIAAVTGGRKDLKLIVRVAHIWLIRDKENPDDIIFMNMILVDEKVYYINRLYK
jgi:hypothetical protein